MARAAGWVGLTIVVISLILSFLLPEPKDAVAEDLKGDTGACVG